MRDSGQRKLTSSFQNHCTLHSVPVGAKPLSPRQCAPSRSIYLSRRLNSHWEILVTTHHLQKWESQLRLRWISSVPACFSFCFQCYWGICSRHYCSIWIRQHLPRFILWKICLSCSRFHGLWQFYLYGVDFFLSSHFKKMRFLTSGNQYRKSIFYNAVPFFGT